MAAEDNHTPRKVNVPEAFAKAVELNGGALKRLAANSRASFANSAAEFMRDHYNVDMAKAESLMAEYIDDIDVNDVTTQQLGPDYFAIQILMAEKIIPYKPM